MVLDAKCLSPGREGRPGDRGSSPSYGLRGLRDSPLLARRLASEPVGTLLGPPPPPVQTATSSTEVDYSGQTQPNGVPVRMSISGVSTKSRPVGVSRP